MSIRIEKNGSDQPCYHFFFLLYFSIKMHADSRILVLDIMSFGLVS